MFQALAQRCTNSRILQMLTPRRPPRSFALTSVKKSGSPGIWQARVSSSLAKLPGMIWKWSQGTFRPAPNLRPTATRHPDGCYGKLV